MSIFPVEAAGEEDQRTILDYYFTAYFSAWLNYQGTLEQRRVTAFAPRFARRGVSVAAYFESYPDGRLIQIVRDPKTWYPSAKHHDDRAPAEPNPMSFCRHGANRHESIVRNKACFGDRVIVSCAFEVLVGRIEPTMRHSHANSASTFTHYLWAPPSPHRPLQSGFGLAAAVYCGGIGAAIIAGDFLLVVGCAEAAETFVL